jgi:two-component system cell cycle sensor histidine kinase PleC
MSFAAPSSYDKTIVDRRRPARSVELSKVLRGTREKLTSRGGLLPRFDHELLIQHALAVRMAAAVMPLPVLLTSFGLSTFVGVEIAAAWGVVAIAGYLLLFVLTRRLPDAGPSPVRPEAWRRIFLGGHLAAGIAWALFAALDCSDCEPLRFEVFQFATLLIAVALTAMVSFTLKSAVATAFLPLVAVLLVRLLGSSEPVTITMNAIGIGAVPFFAIVAEHLRRVAAERLTHQAEKDELIAELETARVMSEEARHRAEEANLAKSRFLATMSHELRTPLNAILGFSEVISNEILGPVGNETYKEYVSDIHSSGQHLLDLINEILDLSRVEAGRYTLNEEAVELTRIARECLGLVQLKAQAKDIRLEAQFEQAMPQLWADERSVRQIILNLLSNAVKFTPQNGKIVLKVGWTAGGGQYVGVFDNGPGIPEEEIPVVLSSFGQGSIAIKSAEQGAGLGLPIVQALMAMHDGEFQLTSELRVGTQALAIFPHSRVLEVMHAFADED